MDVSLYQLGYKKLSQVIFEWQAADRASLLALFIVMEITMHWLWCLFVWLRQDASNTYVDMAMLYPIWLVITLMGLFFWWMVGHLSQIKNDYKRLYRWQIVLIFAYSLYIAVVVLVMGHSSLVSGVSLVGGTMLAMMLVRRRYIWYAFLTQVFLIVLVTTLPYLGVNLPSMRQLNLTSIPPSTYGYQTYSEITNIENAIAVSIFQNGTLSWDSINDIRRSSAFFWRSTHIYLALPKAVFIVYMFSTILLILNNSKKEALQHAHHDELTGLKNRRYGLAQMQQTLKELTEKQDYTVILLDLDLFKHINDSYGHEVGDQVLKEVADVLVDTLSDTDIISRYGGEEFLIVLPGIGHTLAMQIAEQLRINIEEHLIQVDDSLSFQVTTSLGLYTLTDCEQQCLKKEFLSAKRQQTTSLTDNKQNMSSYQKRQAKTRLADMTKAKLPIDTCQRLISMADKALYEAKHRGRNQVVSANEMLAAVNKVESRYGS